MSNPATTELENDMLSELHARMKLEANSTDPEDQSPQKPIWLRRWFLSLILWPLLGLSIYTYTCERKAWSHASTVAEKWKTILDNSHRRMPISVYEAQLAEASGHPERRVEMAYPLIRRKMPLVDQTIVYSWPGLVGEYEVHLYVQPGNVRTQQPHVAAVQGP
ncbi:hypothetical protein [Calycomorphotria hydatis]|uniref:Uncharacterized protein n=1 Tax=Calycomorphotria hydatis TaxID=2528027 RepID=A0A517T424_9PLAN|nr:hypothetical protein [Calycomorphotria hydatis]QDT63120.1 hypothetical protein V22_03200 [Calycomorphotria hydatis]